MNRAPLIQLKPLLAGQPRTPEERSAFLDKLSPELRQLVINSSSGKTVREWLAQDLLPGGFPPYSDAIAPARQLALIDRYPTLYLHADEAPGAGVPPFAREGFAVGVGWLDIVERISAKLAADPDLVVSQIKEKYGRLTVYFDSGEPSAIEAELDLALEEAEAESVITCERCGRPGVLAERGHTVCVLCQVCEKACKP